jgi:hypothetical protein
LFVALLDETSISSDCDEVSELIIDKLSELVKAEESTTISSVWDFNNAELRI